MAREIDPVVSRYMSAVRLIPDLDRAAERELARRWRDKRDAAAADRLVRAHLKHVVAIALKYRRYGLPIAELIAEGNFGVAHALAKFDPERGTRFVTYAAYWVRAYVLSHVIRSWSLVGAGSGALRSKLFFKLRRERVRIMNLTGDPERVPELLARRLGLSVREVSGMLLRLEARDVSLDAKLFTDSTATLLDTLESHEQDQEEALASTELHDLQLHAVRTALSSLDGRERFIVESRLMADAEDALSLAEIGRRLGVSRERARQLEERAKRKLRSRISEALTADSIEHPELVSAA
jgi:RNA polymerase sigma-32 factor